MAPRTINRLNARKVATETKPGRHADGGNLYLKISPNGGKSWTFLYRWQGDSPELGFGSVRDVPLAHARELAADARAKLAQGINPKDARQRSVATATAAKAAPTFGECANSYIEAMLPKWRSEKHIHQWEMTLQHHAALLRLVPVDQIGLDDVLSVLNPMWSDTHETAARLRGRIEKVLDFAKVKGHRSGENPARWVGHLEHILPPRQKLTRGHYAAMPFADVPAFMKRLRYEQDITPRGLEFLILTAVRTNQLIQAKWSEIDLKNKIWTAPATQTKTGIVHRVPLSDSALKLLETMPRRSDFVFPGLKRGKCLSPTAIDAVLMRMKIDKAVATVHGFRSSFRDWASETTDFAGDVVEMALGHKVTNTTEAAYRRGDLLDKRRPLMDAWGSYCRGGGEVK